MLKLEETKDPEAIKSFCKGVGLMKRLMGGVGTSADIDSVVKDNNKIFVLAFDDARPVGFVMFDRIDVFQNRAYGYAIHFCLHTGKGLKSDFEKTKRLIAMAIRHAVHFLDAAVIYAAYPKSSKAVRKLMQYFGFQSNDEFKRMNHALIPADYYFESIKVN